jgi:dihydrofolate reductase
MISPCVKLFIATSLDGYIARSNGSIDWLSTGQDYGYDEFIASIDSLVIGRKTYDQVLSFGPWPYQNMHCYVLTHHPLINPPNLTHDITGKIKNMYDIITNQARKDIWLVGGAEVVTQFYNQNLIDEFIIYIQPIVLGSGILLFKHGLKERELEFSSIKSYPDGIVRLCYKRANPG